MSAWYDLDNSGGLGLGDITTGLSNVGDYLFGSDTNMVTNRGNSYVPSVDTGTLSTSGLFGDIGGYINTGLDWLGDNKDSIDAAAGLFGAYGDYKTAQTAQDYYNSLIAQANAEAARRDEQSTYMQQGFDSSGLLSTVKKQPTNYYSV